MIKKIGFFSDIHLDHSPYQFFPEDYNGVNVWVNAGDTATNPMLYSFFQERIMTIHPYFSIMGNHDFYGKTINHPEHYCHKKVISGITIAGAPLWTDLSNPIDWLNYKDGLIDVAHIGGWQWNQEIYMKHHEYQKEFLFKSNADIIVSHHGPSYQSVSPRYKGDPYNSSFVTELSEWILSMDKPPKYWFHGHIHQDADYMIGDTRVIAHPRGYPGEDNFKDYKPLLLDIEF